MRHGVSKASGRTDMGDAVGKENRHREQIRSISEHKVWLPFFQVYVWHVFYLCTFFV